MTEDIKAFLDSREWLEKRSRDYETPRDDLNNYVTISKESFGSYSIAKVKVQIMQNPSFIEYQDVRIWFLFLRSADEYEIVFQGFISNLDDLIKAFELVGIDNKYLEHAK